MKTVSILIPIYKVEKYISQCARSIFGQTYDYIEYIFVNDCTPDKSIDILCEVLKDFPNRKDCVKIINHQINRGLAAARNTALEHASGEYIMHVDSDDFIAPRTVELAVGLAMKDNSDIVIFDMNIIHDNVIKYSPAMVSKNKDEYIKSLLCRESTVCVCGGLYKKRLYTDNNIKSIEGLNYGEDYVTKPRLVYYANKISHLQLPLYNYVQYNAISYTNNVNMNSINSIVRASEILRTFFESTIDMPKYSYAIEKSDIINKILLLTQCNNKDLKYVNNLYPNIDYSIDYKLSVKHRVILFLSKHSMCQMLKFIKIIWSKMSRS